MFEVSVKLGEVQSVLFYLSPFTGSLPEFPELPFHEVIVKPYRIFYKVKAYDVWDAAVWHGA
jgi:hypothetical protein